MGNIEQSLAWMEERINRVSYSMVDRNGPRSYDCSSAVYCALRAGGFPLRINWNGNTETLFKEQGYLLEEIPAFKRQRGDLFIAGVEGQSLGSYGHAGFVWDVNHIIHCNATDGTIAITPIKNRTGMPVRWFRIKSTNKTELTGNQLVGSFVRVKPTAQRYQTGERIAPFVKGNSYRVLEYRWDQRTKQPAYLLDQIISWVKASDLEY